MCRVCICVRNCSNADLIRQGIIVAANFGSVVSMTIQYIRPSLARHGRTDWHGQYKLNICRRIYLGRWGDDTKYVAGSSTALCVLLMRWSLCNMDEHGRIEHRLNVGRWQVVGRGDIGIDAVRPWWWYTVEDVHCLHSSQVWKLCERWIRWMISPPPYPNLKI